MFILHYVHIALTCPFLYHLSLLFVLYTHVLVFPTKPLCIPSIVLDFFIPKLIVFQTSSSAASASCFTVFVHVCRTRYCHAINLFSHGLKMNHEKARQQPTVAQSHWHTRKSGQCHCAYQWSETSFGRCCFKWLWLSFLTISYRHTYSSTPV